MGNGITPHSAHRTARGATLGSGNRTGLGYGSGNRSSGIGWTGSGNRAGSGWFGTGN